jgi:hypothetical protein
MSIRVMTWAFDQQIPGNLKIVLLALADNANDGGYCWPSQEVIAHKASVSVRNLRRLLNELEDRGLIRIDARRRQDGYKAANGYQLSPDNLSGKPSPANISPDTTEPSHRPTVSDQEPSVEPPKSVNARASELRKIQRQQEADDWDEFWEKYPRKVGKDAAARAWASAIKRENSRLIVDGLDRLLPSLKARDPQYVPHPATWLNAGSWDDEADPAPSPTSRGGTKPQRPPIDPQREWEYR